ncbi:hypothetical protein [Ralstonia sp. ASV6]|uniref:hypothetical protein n=1 Tax=Ralstonia sp. ASV6 TaxID=2795124 RepID=UPI0018EA6F2D|nr:hypothetical protein [Ralstonia sp. ASV6]
MGVNVTSKKGCFESQAKLDTKPDAKPTTVPANEPIVMVLYGAIYNKLCQDTARFAPEAGRKYLARGRLGPDDTDTGTRDPFTKFRNQNTEGVCHIAVFDRTDPDQIKRVPIQRVGPHGAICLTFEE